MRTAPRQHTVQWSAATWLLSANEPEVIKVNNSEEAVVENAGSVIDPLTRIRVLERQKAELEMALSASKQALETCRSRAELARDGVSYNAAGTALGVIEIKCSNAASIHVEPTFMPADKALDWSWKQLRRDLNDGSWNAGEAGTFFGFFLHGWNSRGQYEMQRRIAEGEVVKLND